MYSRESRGSREVVIVRDILFRMGLTGLAGTTLLHSRLSTLSDIYAMRFTDTAVQAS